MTDPTPPAPVSVDADTVVRLVAEKAAAALADAFVRQAVLEAQLAALRDQP